jgi:hypothetical protein
MRAGRRTVAALAALALAAAGCGDSPEDTAHDNGKAVGEALKSLMNADNADQVRAAGQDLRDAVSEAADSAGDTARQQVRVQTDHLNKAIGQFRTAATSSDQQRADAARLEMQSEIQDARTQAAAFRDSGDSKTNAFWQGVKDGYDG